MNSPWQVLGVARGATIDEIRRAYAKLLRQHRPDVDPVGFRRVRDAYELALRLTEAGAIEETQEAKTGTDEDPAPPQPWATWFIAPDAPPPAPVPARPRPLAAPLRTALARARESGRQAVEGRVLAILAHTIRKWPHEPALAGLVLEELASPASRLRLHLSPSDVQHATSFDGTNLTRTLLLAHVAASDWQTLWSTARAIENTPVNPDSLAACEAAAIAAEVVALLQPDLAEHLANHAFRRLPAESRHVLGAVDLCIHAGKQLRVEASWEDKRTLVLALCDPRVRDEDPGAKRAVAIAADTPKAPALASLVAHRFPSAAPQLETMIERAQRKAARRRERDGRQKEGAGARVRLIIGLLFVFSALARLCAGPAPVPRATSTQERILQRARRNPPQPDDLARPGDDKPPGGQPAPRDRR